MKAKLLFHANWDNSTTVDFGQPDNLQDFIAANKVSPGYRHTLELTDDKGNVTTYTGYITGLYTNWQKHLIALLQPTSHWARE